MRAADVVLPSGCTFVVANSLAVSNKAEGAHKRYNMRVVECRAAASVLARALGVAKEIAAGIKTLKASRRLARWMAACNRACIHA